MTSAQMTSLDVTEDGKALLDGGASIKLDALISGFKMKKFWQQHF